LVAEVLAEVQEQLAVLVAAQETVLAEQAQLDKETQAEVQLAAQMLQVVAAEQAQQERPAVP
jgi:hypothetical protein